MRRLRRAAAGVARVRSRKSPVDTKSYKYLQKSGAGGFANVPMMHCGFYLLRSVQSVVRVAAPRPVSPHHGSNRMPAFLKGDPDVTASPQDLRALAVWYREFAERTQNPTIWEARIRSAEELEMNAQALESHALQSAEDAVA